MGFSSSVLYTINDAFCLIDYKAVKGTLTIYNDGYFFSGKSSLSGKFDICSVKILKTSLGIRGLFREKYRPAIRILIPGKKDGVFAIDEVLLDRVINIINEAAQKESYQRKEKRYSYACRKMGQITSSTEAADVGREFTMLSEYKESKKKAEECKKIEQNYKEKEDTVMIWSLSSLDMKTKCFVS